MTPEANTGSESDSDRILALDGPSFSEALNEAEDLVLSAVRDALERKRDLFHAIAGGSMRGNAEGELRAVQAKLDLVENVLSGEEEVSH